MSAIALAAPGARLAPPRRARPLGGVRAISGHTSISPSARRLVVRAAAAASDADDGAVLVTGAAGFIGSHLCEALLARGASVLAVDSLDDGGPYPRDWKSANLRLLRRRARDAASSGARLRVVLADAADPHAMAKLFAEPREDPPGENAENAEDAEDADAALRFDSDDPRVADPNALSPFPPVSRVCHLAARSGVAATFDDPAGAVSANVASTATLLSLASNAARECRSFVLASSGSVYGECAVDSEGEPVPSREDHPTDAPASPYAASKRGAELMARAFASNAGGRLPVTVARIFTVYGPRGRPDMAVFRFVRAASTGGTLFRFGDGQSTWRDYAHVDDVVEGLLAALYRDAKNASSGGIRTSDCGDGFLVVNVASGTPTRLGTLIEEVTRACGGDPGEVEERPGRPGDVGGTYADARRAEETLGWRAKISLREGLRKTALWYAAEEAAPWRDPPPP